MQLLGKGVLGKLSSGSGALTVALTAMSLSAQIPAVTVTERIELPTMQIEANLSSVGIRESVAVPLLQGSIAIPSIAVTQGVEMHLYGSIGSISVKEIIPLPCFQLSSQIGIISTKDIVAVSPIASQLSIPQITTKEVIPLPLMNMAFIMFPITAKELIPVPQMTLSGNLRTITPITKVNVESFSINPSFGVGIKVDIPVMSFSASIPEITADYTQRYPLPAMRLFGKINPIIPTDYNFTVTIEINGAGFLAGDLLMAERVDYKADGSEDPKYKVFAAVKSVTSGSIYEIEVNKNISTFWDMDTFLNDNAIGLEFVKIGSTNSATRGNLIRFVQLGADAPFIEVAKGISSFDDFLNFYKTEFMAGNLSAIGVDENFGSMSGKVGLYTKGNAYIKGYIAGGTQTSTSPISGKQGYFLAPNGDIFFGTETSYIKKSGADLDIKTQKFVLSADKLRINSTDETFFLGTPNSGNGLANYTYGDGIFLGKSDTLYKARIGKAGAQRFQFDGVNIAIIDINNKTIFSSGGAETILTGFTVDDVAITKKDNANKYFGLHSTATYRFFAGADSVTGTNATFGVKNDGSGRMAGFLFADKIIKTLNNEIIIDGNKGSIELNNDLAEIKGNYTPNTGFRILGIGDTEFNNVKVRGVINTTTIGTNITNAVGGRNLFCKAVGNLKSLMSASASSCILDLPNSIAPNVYYNMWSVNDIICIQDDFGKLWKKVSSIAVSSGETHIPIDKIYNYNVPLAESDLQMLLTVSEIQSPITFNTYLYAELPSPYTTKLGKIIIYTNRNQSNLISSIIGYDENNNQVSFYGYTVTSADVVIEGSELKELTFTLPTASAVKSFYLMLSGLMPIYGIKTYQTGSGITITFDSGYSAGNAFRKFNKGSIVANYGQNNGLIEILANSTDEPYPRIKMGKSGSDPSLGWEANVIIGNLKNLQSYTSDKYGAIFGNNIGNSNFQGLIAAEDKVQLINADLMLGNRTQFHYDSDYATNNQSGIWQGKVSATDKYGFYFGDKNNYFRFDGVSCEFGTSKDWTLRALNSSGVTKATISIIPSVLNYGSDPAIRYTSKQVGSNTSYDLRADLYTMNNGILRGYVNRVWNDSSSTNGTGSVNNDFYHVLQIQEETAVTYKYSAASGYTEAEFNKLKFGTDVAGNQKDITNLNRVQSDYFTAITRASLAQLTINDDINVIRNRLNGLLSALNNLELITSA